MDLKDVTFKLATEPEFAETLLKAPAGEIPAGLQNLPAEELEALRVYISKGNLCISSGIEDVPPLSEPWFIT